MKRIHRHYYTGEFASEAASSIIFDLIAANSPYLNPSNSRGLKTGTSDWRWRSPSGLLGLVGVPSSGLGYPDRLLCLVDGVPNARPTGQFVLPLRQRLTSNLGMPERSLEWPLPISVIGMSWIYSEFVEQS